MALKFNPFTGKLDYVGAVGGGGPTGPAGGDLAGTYPNPTVDGLQGTPVSSATPYNGQVLQFDGTNWVPGSIPSGGSGGGGVVYFLNFNTAADAPVTNIPQTPNASKELGITAETTATSYQSAILSTASYNFLASFVTDLNVPSATAIPAGIWDFNIFAESTTTNSANQVYYKIEILKYDGVNAPTLLATSNDTYIYDPTEITQYVSSVVMPQTTILATDRIVVYLYGGAHQNNNRLTFHFGDGYPSHTHSTMPSVTGTGVVKVVNGVFQSPASTIVNSDVSASAAIDVSKLAMSTNRVLGRTSAGTGAVEQLTPVGITVSGGNITGIGGTLGTVDNAVPRADGTGGYTAQGSDIIIDDATTTTQNNIAIRNDHTGQTNSALVLTPKGTGALIAGPKPDGTATGGNARGAGAVDLVLERNAAVHVASGANSFAVGYRCTASGAQSFVGGSNCVASGAQSVAIGSLCDATGAYSVALGNSDATNRSAFAAGESNTASGINSFAVGRANSASATGASVFGGDGTGGNTANAAYSSVLGGWRGLADRYSMHAHSAGQFSAQGDAQRARFVLRNSTASNTPTELFLDGSSTRLTIPVNKAMGFTIQVIASIQGMAENAYFVRKGMIVNDNATTTLVGSVESVGTDQKSAGATATDVTVTASDANDALIITVTGIAAQNWRWVASVDAVEVQYA